MRKRKPLWNTLSEPARQIAVRQIMTYFENERDDPIGHIAAEDLLDSILEHIQADLYNQAINDAKIQINDKMSDLIVELDLLQRN